MKKQIKVVIWNVNSIRVRIKQLNILIAAEQPDIILLQEIKCEQHNFPIDHIDEVDKYNISIYGQKLYNGVAILSKFPLEDIKYSFPCNPCPEQARFIEANCLTDVGYVKVISVYVPNGGEVNSNKFRDKLVFIEALTRHLNHIRDLGDAILVGGDFNVAPYDNDVYSPDELQNTTCFTLQERVAIRKLINSNFIDIYRLFEQGRRFSWWDYRAGAFERNAGMRIDYLLGTPILAQKAISCHISYDTRSNSKASDHAPVIAVFEKS